MSLANSLSKARVEPTPGVSYSKVGHWHKYIHAKYTYTYVYIHLHAWLHVWLMQPLYRGRH